MSDKLWNRQDTLSSSVGVAGGLASAMLAIGLIGSPLGAASRSDDADPGTTPERQTSGPPHPILYQSLRGGEPIDVWIMNGDGSEPVNLTGNVYGRHPTGFPDGSKIAFRSDRDGNPEIYAMNADGTEPENLTRHPASDANPSVSPDGRRIVFDSDRDSTVEAGELESLTANPAADIYVMDADGANVVRLTENEVVDSHPFWSPDGTRIAFYSNRDDPDSEAQDIYVMDADGGNVTRLTDDPADDRYPSWSPDGTRIAFTSDRDGNPEIYTMASDGSGPTRLTRTDAPDNAPDWSPDGGWIVFASEQDGNSEVFVMRADGSDRTQLTFDGLGSTGNARWLRVDTRRR